MRFRGSYQQKILRSPHITGLVAGMTLMVAIHVIGTLGYHYIGRPHASWIDSFYFTFITVATIGYGETVDLTHHPYGRLFTVFIAVVGIATMSYLFSTMVAFLVDSNLNSALRKKRMEKSIAKLNGHYIVCGIGRVGSNVAVELVKTERPFVVVETQREAIDLWLEHHSSTLYLHEDAADDEALLRAGVMKAAGVFAVTADDSHNIMVALSVKMLNPQARVVVRLHDISNAKKARLAGADEIVSPDFTGGMRIVSAMVRPHVVNFMDQMMQSAENFRVEEVVVPAETPPTPVGELVPRARDYMLMALHENGSWVFNPAESHEVRGGTTLILMASPGGRAAVEAALA